MTTHALGLILFVIIGIIVNKMNTMEPILLKHKPWYPHFIQLILPSVIGIVFVTFSFARNRRLRASVLREAREIYARVM